MACLILAGGDASRLGLPIPKGMFNPGIEGVSSIFELITLKVKKMNDICLRAFPDSPTLGRDRIVLIIMTNPENYHRIVDFFKENDYFGYKTTIFFPQSHLPVTDPEGKILFKSPSKILFAPNGNGAFFSSTNGKAVFKKLGEIGVEYLHITGVDNVLCKWADPKMVGLISSSNERSIVCKYTRKKHALEKVGVFALTNGSPSIIEYTLIGDELAQKTNDQGELFYNHSNIVNFMFKLTYLNENVLVDENLSRMSQKYNVSIKDAKYFDLHKNEVIEGKVVKFELFVNESITYCSPLHFHLLECHRDDVGYYHFRSSPP